MTELDQFILESISNCDTDDMLGGEIRSLELSLFQVYVENNDPIYEFLLALINKYQDDKQLGFYVRRIEEKLFQYLTN
jgi:hypothetical protein